MPAFGHGAAVQLIVLSHGDKQKEHTDYAGRRKFEFPTLGCSPAESGYLIFAAFFAAKVGYFVPIVFYSF
jgi:hypothetical protein